MFLLKSKQQDLIYWSFLATSFRLCGGGKGPALPHHGYGCLLWQLCPIFCLFDFSWLALLEGVHPRAEQKEKKLRDLVAPYWQ